MGGAVKAKWVGALWVDGVLVDAPPGVERALAQQGLLEHTHAVVLPAGRTRAVAGLIGLWDALSQVGRRDVTVLHHLGDERTPLLAQAWSLGWQDRLTVSLDGIGPGMTVDLKRVAVTLVPLRLGEASRGAVVPLSGGGLRLETAQRVVAWAPACRPGSALDRLCEGADLAVIEVAAAPWPASDHAMRPTLQQAIAAAAGANEVWLVGDDGARLDQGDAS